MCFFLRRRKCSIVRSYEKFIEICREFVEIMDLRYNFGSGCAKNVYFYCDKMTNNEGT